MSAAGPNLAHCHRCVAKAGVRCAGACPCPADGGDVLTHAESGYCPLKLFGDGRPPAGWAGKILEGAAGIAKALARIDRPPESVIAEREASCAACPHLVVTLKLVRRCELCGCATAAKTRNASQACPDGRWPAVPPAVE